MIRLSDYLQTKYGEKVYKIALSSGCACPNRDGTAGWGGCTFCSEGGSGEFAQKAVDIDTQIEEGKKLIAAKTNAAHFIAYFQSFTNTYGDLETLKALYLKTIQREDIAILSLATRPDCLSDEMIRMLTELNRIKPVWIELGLQTIHERTAEEINRCYPLEVFEDAYRRLKEAGIEVIVHVIFGLPGETKDMIIGTIRYLSNLDPPLDGIKIQMLQLLKHTKMARDFQENPWPMLSLEEYTDLVAKSLHLLPDKTVVHRITGDPPGRLLIEPWWTRNKKKVLNTIWKKYRDT
ncbi:MAG: TIGR01212 family radical SAM protein [Firmicutes bacterium]|nr:TIGR01212 family radical SAM protein [Bacillota bacterium]